MYRSLLLGCLVLAIACGKSDAKKKKADSPAAVTKPDPKSVHEPPPAIEEELDADSIAWTQHSVKELGSQSRPSTVWTRVQYDEHQHIRDANGETHSCCVLDGPRPLR